jgi:hypothetical protein
MRSHERSAGHIDYQCCDHPLSDEESGERYSFILTPCSLVTAASVGDGFRDPDGFSSAGHQNFLPEQENILTATPNGGEGFTTRNEMPACDQKEIFPDGYALGDGELYLRSG